MSHKGRLALFIGIFCFICLGGLYFSIRVWMPFMWGFVAPGILGILLWAVLDRKLIFDFFTLKTTKYGIDMGAIILLSILFIGVINFVGARHSKTFDFSTNQINSLSEQSKKLINLIQSDFSIKFFYKTGVEEAEVNKRLFRDLVKRYQDINSKIQLEFIEMNEKAKLTQEYGATRGIGEAFIEYKGNKNRIENYTEQDFTNALIKVTREKKKTIFFLEGHNERPNDDEKAETGLFSFKQLLEKNSYTVKQLSLISTPDIPQECDALIIATPLQSFQEHETKAIEKYLERGGSVFIALDTLSISNGVFKILDKVGVELESQFVFNVFNTPMGQVVNAQAPTVGSVFSAQSEITKVFVGNQITVFSKPHSLKQKAQRENIKVDFIVKTPESSVALKELDSSDYTGTPQSFNLVAEVKGKYSSNSTADFSMVIVSDIDFMTNILLYQNLNRDLALNSLSYLAKDQDLISVSPKETAVTKILLPPPEFNQYFKFIIIGIFLPLPFIFMMISLVLWYKRRHA